MILFKQSRKKDKENELEFKKLVKKQQLLKNILKKSLSDIEKETSEFKLLVYEQIKNDLKTYENIDDAGIDIEKVKSPIKGITLL